MIVRAVPSGRGDVDFTNVPSPRARQALRHVAARSTGPALGPGTARHPAHRAHPPVLRDHAVEPGAKASVASHAAWSGASLPSSTGPPASSTDVCSGSG